MSRRIIRPKTPFTTALAELVLGLKPEDRADAIVSIISELEEMLLEMPAGTAVPAHTWILKVLASTFDRPF